MTVKLSQVAADPITTNLLPGNRHVPPLSGMADESVIDLRDIDKLLTEVAGMVGRWNLFKKFLTEAFKVCLCLGLGLFQYLYSLQSYAE